MALLTTDANEKAQAIHPRMPLMLPEEEAAAAWIAPDADPATLEGYSTRPRTTQSRRIR